MFGDILKDLRKTNKLTQEELGEKLGVLTSSISNWETNKATPTYEILKEIAKMFHVTTDYLLDYNIDDLDKMQKLKMTLKEAGINDINKAMQILEVLKEDNKDEK